MIGNNFKSNKLQNEVKERVYWNNKKGGDIDLYIETNIKEKILEHKIKMLVELEKFMGEQKIDIVVNNFFLEKAIYKVAKHEGIQLWKKSS